MHLDDEFRAPAPPASEAHSNEPLDEARRVLQICNACRYCEGYCEVFQAMAERRTFAHTDIRYLADLCHNCRSCYYACQYAPPHAFSINVPRALADVRARHWVELARPAALARALLGGVGALIAIVVLCSLAIGFVSGFTPGTAFGTGFYQIIPHSVMVAIFAPAFVFAVFAIGSSVRRWRRANATVDARIDARAIDRAGALGAAVTLENLKGGHGEGCLFESTETFSHWRRYAHHATLIGFALCFAATSVATVLHYGFDRPAPYPFWSVPKLLGVPGGVLLCLGTAGLFALKRRADTAPNALGAHRAEIAFIALLFIVSASGLALYAVRGTPLMRPLLIVHLGTVLGFFLTAPYTKMVHGFYRLAALTQRAGERARTRSVDEDRSG